MTEAAAQRAGRYAIFWNEGHSAVILEQAGFWSIEDGDACARDLAPQLERSRAVRGGGALFLVDASHGAVQAPAVMGEAPRTMSTTLDARDRIAVVVPSSLAKMQMQRIPQADAAHAYFVSRNAAETWLYAYCEERRAS